jgi:hypothetical protein
LNDKFLLYIFKMVISNLYFYINLCEMCYGVTEYK